MNVISDDQLWPLFIGMVCETLTREGFVGDKYEFATSLDMSFDEILTLPISDWKSAINEDLEEYRAKEGADFFK
ncbi:hypothetical protein KMB89_gp56 [Citrobacter phage HCF1]|uniref:Uncharacterized protein n=2 Tax=Drexlerviridae TaxID=2731691 RepID=A0A6M5C968_9CAUD|nr:hypothetical protein KMB89_gp56 [Citrobacter phage HCF1]